MKNLFLGVLILLSLKSLSQTKSFIDQPYLETEVEVDSLIVPDRIYLTIVLNETDSRNKKSTEDLERLMETTLKSLSIDIEESLTLLDFSSDFKKYFLTEQKILKTKMYSLLVKDALTAGKVLTELEKVGISNVSIEKTEYSKAEEVIIDLKSKAILKSQKYAESMTKPLNQKVGKAIFISDFNSITNEVQGQVSGIKIRGFSSVYGSRAAEQIAIEFDKIKFKTKVTVKYILD